MSSPLVCITSNRFRSETEQKRVRRSLFYFFPPYLIPVLPLFVSPSFLSPPFLQPFFPFYLLLSFFLHRFWYVPDAFDFINDRQRSVFFKLLGKRSRYEKKNEQEGYVIIHEHKRRTNLST